MQYEAAIKDENGEISTGTLSTNHHPAEIMGKTVLLAVKDGNGMVSVQSGELVEVFGIEPIRLSGTDCSAHLPSEL